MSSRKNYVLPDSDLFSSPGKNESQSAYSLSQPDLSTSGSLWPKSSDEQYITTLLQQNKSVKDCLVVSRKTILGEQKMVAYVVPSESFSLERLQSYIQNLVPASLHPVTYIPLSSLPLTPQGDVDQQALTLFPVNDSETIHQWETEIQSLPDVTRAAVVIQEYLTSSQALHRSDLLCKWKSTANFEIEGSLTLDAQIQTVDSDPILSFSSVLAMSQGGELPDDPEMPITLNAMLVKVASQELGDRITYLQADSSELKQSYKSLLTEAECILAGLRQRGLTSGDKVIFQMESPQDILSVFWGCILGGFIPVIAETAPTYNESNRVVEKLCNIWTLLEQPLIVTTEKLQESIRCLSQWLPELEICSVDALRKYKSDSNHHPSQPDDTAFFNLTSGSTGTPKCICLTHRNLISRARGANLLNGYDSEDVILNWLPFDHIGSISDWHIRCVLLGCHLVYSSKEYVLGRPLNWIDLLHRYRINHSWAPNFAYALVNEALQQDRTQHLWDLTCVRSLLSAGEAISSNAVVDFIQNLEVYGFPKTAIRPAFGMAEMGSGITYFQATETEPLIRHSINAASLQGSLQRVPTDHPNCTTFTDLGSPIPGVSIQIVNTENVLLPEDTVGFLQVKGDAVSPGYYKNPAVNAETFLEDGWFNTGDLGFIANGNLVIAGRAKESIIINGANYYNHEIEAAVEVLQGVEVSYTAACAVREMNSATEKLAIFFHIPYKNIVQRIELLKTIRQTIIQKIGLNPEFLIPVSKETIPKTAIGKIQRSQLSQQFENGEFDVILKEVDCLLENHNTLPDWFYRKIWRPKQLLNLPAQKLVGSTLIFVESSGLGEVLGSKLNNDVYPCVRVQAGSTFFKLGRDRYQINPKNSEHYSQLLKALAEDNILVAQILHLWSYSKLEPEIKSQETLETALNLGTYSILFLLQAFKKLQGDDRKPVRLMVISSHVQSIDFEEFVMAEKSPVLGVMKAASQENPWLSCCHLDLAFEPFKINLPLVWQELSSLQSETEVAYRRGQRFISCLEKIDWSQTHPKPLPFKQNGLYVLSGGLGGIGVEIARYLLVNHQVRLLLLGRTTLSEPLLSDSKSDSLGAMQRVAAYRELQQLGEVQYAAVDLCDLAQLHVAITQATSHWQCELEGIIHLAGSAPERSLTEETHNTLAETLRPKVLGTWTLHQLLKNRPGSLFISFSSLASYFGGANIGAYTAANTFLGHFTDYQRKCGFQSHCFAWGMWEDIGMSRQSLAQDILRAKGFQSVTRHQGLSSLLAGLHHDQRHLLIGLDGSHLSIQRHVSDSVPEQTLVAYITVETEILPSDLSSFEVYDSFGTPVPCQLKILPELPLTASGEIDRDQLAAWNRRSRNNSVKPRTEIEQELANIWQDVLDIPQIGIQDNFFELGGSSLQAARMFAEIDRVFGKNLPLATLFKAQTIAQITQYLSTTTDSPTWSSLVKIQPSGSKPPLFCIHGAGGNILMYRGFMEYLGSDQPLYGLQPKGLDSNETPIEQLPEMAALYVEQMRQVQPKGPYFLTGLSVGGLIAFEMAQILQTQGQQVSLLAMIESLGPGYPKLLPPLLRLKSLLPYILTILPKRIINRLPKLLKLLHKANRSAQTNEDRGAFGIEALKDKGRLEQNVQTEADLDSIMLNATQKRSLHDWLDAFSLSLYRFTPWAFIVPRFYLESGKELPTSSLQKVQEANVRAMLDYQPKAYPGNIVVFRAEQQPFGCYSNPTLGWETVVTGNIELHDIPGYHSELLLYEPKSLQVLGQQFKDCLDRAQVNAHG